MVAISCLPKVPNMIFAIVIALFTVFGSEFKAFGGLPQDMRAAFRYVILSDEIINPSGVQEMRNVHVLLDDGAFSEKTLKELFRLLVKRYPQPEWMDVWVVTSLKQVATPEEEELPRASERDSHSDYDNYNHAVLIREGPNEFFRYSLRPPSPEMKTIVVKGVDSATGQRAPAD